MLGISWAYHGHISGISQAYLGHIFDISWAYIFDISLEYLRLSRAYLGHILGIHCAYLVNILCIVWASHGHFLGLIWAHLLDICKCPSRYIAPFNCCQYCGFCITQHIYCVSFWYFSLQLRLYIASHSKLLKTRCPPLVGTSWRAAFEQLVQRTYARMVQILELVQGTQVPPFPGLTRDYSDLILYLVTGVVATWP